MAVRDCKSRNPDECSSDHPRLNTGYTDWILNDIGNAGGNPEASAAVSRVSPSSS
jgi:hypothetical protein